MIKYIYEMEISTMARPKKNRIVLTDEDVKRLKKILKKKDTNQILSMRWILLNLDENQTFRLWRNGWANQQGSNPALFKKNNFALTVAAAGVFQTKKTQNS